MSDIVFIKNKNDYINYKQLKPVKYYSRQKVKFICSSCKKETIKLFYYLDTSFLCGKCKTKQTCLEKYGVENPSKMSNFKEKVIQTSLKKYGVTNYSKTDEFETKRKETCLEKYGVENPFQLEEFKEKSNKTRIEKYGSYSFPKTDEFETKRKETCLEKYGVENPFQLEEFKEKSKQTCLEKYGVDNYRTSLEWKNISINRLNLLLLNYNLKIIKIENNTIYIICNNCNKMFTYSYSHFYVLLQKYNKNFCPFCSKVITTSKSGKEKELLNFIKLFYKNLILENDRHIISPKELDIYLPDLKLAFEFDGAYWHADPRFYKDNDIIINRTAKEIWERDKQKDLMCEQLNIKLIRIKEYDWDTNKEQLKQFIKQLVLSV